MASCSSLHGTLAFASFFLTAVNQSLFLQMNIGHPGQEENKRKTKRKRKETSSSGEDFEDDEKDSKKKRGRPRTVKREDIEGFSDQEIRR